MEEKNLQEDDVIDLQELIGIFLRRLKLIIVLTLAVGAIAFLYSSFFITPIYTASTTMYVNNTKKAVVDSISSSDVTASKQLAATCVEFIGSDKVLNGVAERVSEQFSGRLKSPLEASDIKGMVRASSKNETEVLAVYVSTPDPEMSAAIANEIAETAPEVINDYMGASSVKTIDQALCPTRPSSPNVRKNTIIGLVLGFVLGTGLAFCLELLDTRVKSEDDLEKMLDYPVIGVIPTIVEEAAETASK